MKVKALILTLVTLASLGVTVALWFAMNSAQVEYEEVEAVVNSSETITHRGKNGSGTYYTYEVTVNYQDKIYERRMSFTTVMTAILMCRREQLRSICTTESCMPILRASKLLLQLLHCILFSCSPPSGWFWVFPFTCPSRGRKAGHKNIRNKRALCRNGPMRRKNG